MKVSILGSTGSIGTQTLDVVKNVLPEVEIVALTGHRNTSLLKEQVREFKPKVVCVPDESTAKELKGLSTEVVIGEEGLEICAAETGAEVVVNALVGKVGLKPTVAAIKKGIDIALANKETLVTAGEYITGLAYKRDVSIKPIDSEHSAIWQCLSGNKEKDIERIILTASGGAFRTWGKEKIANAAATDALKHPNWDMGAKITIDSATLMNKGLEVIEAMWLFNQPLDKIQVLVHPQSIIHSMVQYHDGGVMAQLGLPDMRLPILYALSSPDRVKTDYPRLDFLKVGNLTFEAPDTGKFPCLELAYHAAKVGGTLPAVMNYVNEWAVGEYLKGKIKFYDISDLIAQAFGAYTVKPLSSVDDVLQAEEWALAFTTNKG